MNELAHALAWALVSCTPASVCDPANDVRIELSEQQPARDPWLGSDKFTHAGVTWAAASFMFAGARSAGMSSDDAAGAAVAGALALGVAKEIRDSRSTFFSYRDLLADAAGAAAAYFFLREVR